MFAILKTEKDLWMSEGTAPMQNSATKLANHSTKAMR